MHARPPAYKSYLLRYWQERQSPPHTACSWRFSLDDPLTGEREGFANLEAMFRHLEQQLKRERDNKTDPKKEGDFHV